MIAIEMTVAEMVNLCSNVSIDRNLRGRIISALEKAVESASTNSEKYRFNLLSYSAGNKIPTIKAVRMAFNWGLKEAKEWVENACPGAMVWSTTPWMSYDKAAGLRDALLDVGCDCGPLVREATKP